MPKVIAEISPEEMGKRKGKPGVTSESLLAPYVAIVVDVPIGGGLRIGLEEGEDQRTTKRRITTAAKTLGKRIKWRAAPTGELEFQVLEPKGESGEVPKQRRSRKPRAEAESTNVAS